MKTKAYAKLIDGQLITSCAAEDDQGMIEMLVADGFRPYDEDAGEPEVGQYQRLEPVYFEQDDKISLYWEVVDDDPAKIGDEIQRLESLLAATDYQVVKSFEYSLAGEEVPYDIAALHTERETLRTEIRQLESLLLADA
ncbi:hypothetical protein KML24007_03830 [Alistipes indistinctus]|uniref:hypothetical protein n=1 Tax=Alistipes indistinctus TaxID=626932 RepID=UPI0036F2792E